MPKILVFKLPSTSLIVKTLQTRLCNNSNTWLLSCFYFLVFAIECEFENPRRSCKNRNLKKSYFGRAYKFFGSTMKHSVVFSWLLLWWMSFFFGILGFHDLQGLTAALQDAAPKQMIAVSLRKALQWASGGCQRTRKVPAMFQTRLWWKAHAMQTWFCQLIQCHQKKVSHSNLWRRNFRWNWNKITQVLA